MQTLSKLKRAKKVQTTDGGNISALKSQSLCDFDANLGIDTIEMYNVIYGCNL